MSENSEDALVKNSALPARPTNSQRNSIHSDDLGLGLKPGDYHYRAFVGPPADYDLIAAMTFNLLTTLGLRQHHSLLDLGCGSLRVGRLLIPYLNKEKYFGVEPNEWLVQEGIRNEIGDNLLQIKRPRFLFSDAPGMLQTAEVTFDFAVAQSIFSHCGLDLLVPWLSSIAKCLAPTGVLLATFLPDEEDTTSTGWIYPACVKFKPDTLKNAAASCGLKFEILDWRHPRQTWALFAAPLFDGTWFRNKPLTWNTMLESVTKNAACRDRPSAPPLKSACRLQAILRSGRAKTPTTRTLHYGASHRRLLLHPPRRFSVWRPNSYEISSLTSAFSSFNSATEASIFARLNSLSGTSCTISHLPARMRIGKELINPFPRRSCHRSKPPRCASCRLLSRSLGCGRYRRPRWRPRRRRKRPRALMMAAPRCCTAGMNVSFSHFSSPIT